MDLAASNNGNNNNTALPTRDEVYCLELAKRSVARAALHLGIPSMTNDVLDVLGDVLQDYLQRFSAVLALGVETSGRSTQHVNALDALRAVELCTSPAVRRVHFTSSGVTESTSATTGTNTANPEDNGSITTNGNRTADNPSENHPDPGSWQGLAAFCFGPQWQDEEKEPDMAEFAQGSAGGKVGPTGGGMDNSAKDCQEGWRAPFPDEVPPFPQCQTSVSNPHALSPSDVLTALYGPQQSMENPMDILRGPNWITSAGAEQERMDMETMLNQTPEAAWGGLNSNHKKTEDVKMEHVDNKPEESNPGKRKLENDDDNQDGEAKNEKEEGKAGDKMDTSEDKDKEKTNDTEPPKKKVKLEDGTGAAAKDKKTATPKKNKKTKDEKEAESQDADDKNNQAPTEGGEAAKANLATTSSKPTTGPTFNYVPTFFPPIPTVAAGADLNRLRKTTVVDDVLEQSAKETKGASNKGNTAMGLRSALVQLGTSYWGSQADAPAEEMVPVGRAPAVAPAGPINPLGRASGSRVSKILEGSMDAATMQQ